LLDLVLKNIDLVMFCHHVARSSPVKQGFDHGLLLYLSGAFPFQFSDELCGERVTIFPHLIENPPT
jgi:hypothetical protein